MASEPGVPLSSATIDRLAVAVYPSFALLAGMQLDVFTPLQDGPLTAEEVAQALGVSPAKLRPLLYALVVVELLTVDGGRFANTSKRSSSWCGGARPISAAASTSSCTIGRRPCRQRPRFAPASPKTSSISPT